MVITSRTMVTSSGHGEREPKDTDRNEVLKRQIQVIVESFHDHLKMVAEGAASQNETVVRQIGELRTELKTEIGQVRTELKTEIGQLRTELKTEIGQVRAELKAEIGQVRTELRAFRQENASEHKTMFEVLSDHETRITALERRGS